MSFGAYPNEHRKVIQAATEEVLGFLERARTLEPLSEFRKIVARRVIRAVEKMKYHACVELAISPDQWILDAIVPITYSILIDFAYDESLPKRRAARAHQAATLLLCRHAGELATRANRALLRRLQTYLIMHSKYRIWETQWGKPKDFHRLYAGRKYSQKQAMYLFPIEFLSRHRTVVLRAIYIDSFLIHLLIDDIVDIEDDLRTETLSSVIVSYYRDRGRLPEPGVSRGDLIRLMAPEIAKLQSAIRSKVEVCSNAEATIARLIVSEIDHDYAMLKRKE